MINAFDLVAVIVVVMGVLRSIGGPVKIIKGIAVLLLIFIVFGVVSQIILNSKILPENAANTVKESYAYRVSITIIKFIYPAIEQNVPKINAYVKENIIAVPTPEVEVPKVVLPEKAIPKLQIPAKPAAEK